MTHAGEELGLGLVGQFRLGLGLDQRGLGIFAIADIFMDRDHPLPAIFVASNQGYDCPGLKQGIVDTRIHAFRRDLPRRPCGRPANAAELARSTGDSSGVSNCSSDRGDSLAGRSRDRRQRHRRKSQADRRHRYGHHRSKAGRGGAARNPKRSIIRWWRACR